METVGNDEEDILRFHTGAVQFIQKIFDGKLAVACLLFAAFDSVRYDEDDF